MRRGDRGLRASSGSADVTGTPPPGIGAATHDTDAVGYHPSFDHPYANEAVELPSC